MDFRRGIDVSRSQSVTKSITSLWSSDIPNVGDDSIDTHPASYGVSKFTGIRK